MAFLVAPGLAAGLIFILMILYCLFIPGFWKIPGIWTSLKNYDPNDVVGQAGLEQQYESDLQGTKGISKFRIDAQGKNLGEIGEEQAPVPGKNLVLTPAQLVANGGIQPVILDSAAVRATAGFGISWKSPVGPVRLDLAYPIKKESFDKTQLFHVSFGTRF